MIALSLLDLAGGGCSALASRPRLEIKTAEAWGEV